MTEEKPDGWCQFVLAMDCETTGLCFKTPDPTENPVTGEKHQAVSWGFIVADSHTLEPVEELYLEIMWNDDTILQKIKDPKFGTRAEEIHKLTFEHLEENGMEEKDALAEILKLIQKYWGTKDTHIRCLGHNVATFDLIFLKSLLRRHGFTEEYVSFSNRQVDTSSGGFLTFEAYTSDELFKQCKMKDRGTHNALEDTRMTLRAAKTMREIFQLGLSELNG